MYREIAALTPEQMLRQGAHPRWGFWGEAHCRGYQDVLKFYIEHPGARSGPPPKEVFMPVGTKVQITGDVEVREGTIGWIRKIGDDGWTAWISSEDAKYDGTATWGIWCSWSVLQEV